MSLGKNCDNSIFAGVLGHFMEKHARRNYSAMERVALMILRRSDSKDSDNDAELVEAGTRRAKCRYARAS